MRETIDVTESHAPLGLSADQAAGAVVIEGTQLDALPDDPDELADALQALAGSAAGPNGGQVFVDGFSNGRMPPRSAIRQIRLNSSPFSAEYDRPGFGRIEILTKPGSESYHGQATLRFNDAALNTRDPYATSKPSYQRTTWDADLGGPLVKNRASFFVDFDHRAIEQAQLVNATVLGPGYTLVPYNDTLVVPQWRTSISPRVDTQLGASHTLTLRYAYTSTEQDDAGVGGFSLPSRGFDISSRQHMAQIGETAVLGKAVNELRLQWTRTSRRQDPGSTEPTLRCRTPSPAAARDSDVSTHADDRLELNDLLTWNAGPHALRAGLRARGVQQSRHVPPELPRCRDLRGYLRPRARRGRETRVLDPEGNLVLVPVTSAERYRRTVPAVDPRLLGRADPAARRRGQPAADRGRRPLRVRAPVGLRGVPAGRLEGPPGPLAGTRAAHRAPDEPRLATSTWRLASRRRGRRATPAAARRRPCCAPGPASSTTASTIRWCSRRTASTAPSRSSSW